MSPKNLSPVTKQETKRDVRRIYFYGAFVLLLILQIGFIQSYLPVSEWFTRKAIYTDDYSISYGHVLDTKYYLSHYGRTWGYNPYQRAGTTTHTITSVNSNGWAAFSFLLFFLPTEISFKLYFLLALLSLPFLCYWTGSNFGLRPNESLLCGLLGILYLHLSIATDFLYWGSVSYVWSCYLSVWLASLFYRYLKERKAGYLLAFTVFFAAGFWIHIFTSVHLFIPLLISYLFHVRRLAFRTHVLIFFCAGLVLISNLPWLLPFLDFVENTSTTHPLAQFHVSQSLLEPLNTYFRQSHVFNQYLHLPYHKSAKVDTLLLILGILGMSCWWKAGEKCKTTLFGGTAGFLFLLAYYGSFFAWTASLTPLRFIIAMNLCLVFPAAAGARELYRIFVSDKSSRVKAGCIIVAVYYMATFLYTPYNHIYIKKDYRLHTDIPNPLKELVHWIKDHTSQEGRILIEHSDFETMHQYYGTHLPYLLPNLTQREYIGNLSIYTPTDDTFSSFSSTILFLKDIQEYSVEEAIAYMDLYNIQWVICWTPEAKAFFNTFPSQFQSEPDIDKFSVYRVNRSPTFFLTGTGTVKATFNRIELAEVVPEDGHVVLSYHWMKYLKADPPTAIEPVFLLKDPVGFIRLTNPPEEVVIYNSYRG